jgi:hypothetical protein
MTISYCEDCMVNLFRLGSTTRISINSREIFAEASVNLEGN